MGPDCEMSLHRLNTDIPAEPLVSRGLVSRGVSLLVLLVIAFFAVTDFFRSNVELTFSFLLVLRLSLHAVYYAKNETSEQSLYMFLDARPFGSLQAFKLCFCLEDPQD